VATVAFVDGRETGIMEHRRVEVSIEADHRFVRVVRLVASGVASIMGVDVDAVDDLRIAVDEGCTWLLNHGDGTPIDVQFRWGEQAPLEVIGETGAGPAAVGDASVDRLVEAILAASCAAHQVEFVDGRVRFRLTARVDAAERASWPPETVG
jgi:hypothetical protein